jgi:hypothetical protein
MNTSIVRNNNCSAITHAEYRAFQDAYDFFNAELFNGSLPQVLITLQRKARSGGYFAPQRFNGRLEKADVHEIALNPDGFTGRTDKWVLSVLVHEQAHAWQKTYGKYSGNYHNKEWASKMDSLGLVPSSTGSPGGRRTGQSMRHYIAEDGPYQKAYQKLISTGFQLHWQSKPEDGQKARNKTKFTCPNCGQNAWGKPNTRLICGICCVADSAEPKMEPALT